VSEAALDRAAVEELQRVLRPEPEGAARPPQRLVAFAVPGKRPREDVVAVDRRPVCVRATCEHERVRQRDAVVDVEERGLKIRLDAVRREQPLDDADQPLLSTGSASVACKAFEVTEGTDELR
jgi:hypothetical protein